MNPMRKLLAGNGGGPRRTERAMSAKPCECAGVKTRRTGWPVWMVAMVAWLMAFALQAQSVTNETPGPETNAAATDLTATNAVTPTAASVPAEIAAPKPQPPEPARPAGKLDFSSFKTIAERNIFNGNRSGQRITSTRSSSQQRSVRVESFTLVGTLLSAKGPVAFFDGTGSDFHKSLKPGGKIGNFTIREILHAGIRLTEGTNEMELRVGNGMRREDEGLWKVSSGGASYASSSGGASRSDSSSYRSSSSNGRSSDRNGSSHGHGESRSSSSSDSPPPGDLGDVLKRLMEQREKDNK